MLNNLIIVFNTSPHTHNMHCTRPFDLTSPIFTLVGARNANPRWTVTSQPIAVRVWHRMSEIGHVSGISCCWHSASSSSADFGPPPRFRPVSSATTSFLWKCQHSERRRWCTWSEIRNQRPGWSGLNSAKDAIIQGSPHDHTTRAPASCPSSGSMWRGSPSSMQLAKRTTAKGQYKIPAL